ncbi:MAG: aldehyde dehydrogenase family protein [Acidobacteria bacterium]|nr:aldehyde dehydrogenase family protein [Acidobacteriota bacterium]
MDGPTQLLIGGKFQDAVSGKTFASINPATEEVIADVAEADAPDIDSAVKAARTAFNKKNWRNMAARERSRLLWKLGDLIMEHADELAIIETMDNGKPLFESRNVDIPMAAETFYYYAGWCTKIEGETIPVPGNYLNYTLREPYGVCGIITPWNFPLLMVAWKLAPALACGNTAVLKIAEETPLSGLRLGQLCQEAGFPDGVVNVVPGYGETAGRALVSHPDVDKISFTGSTAVGKEIVRTSAETLKKVSLELGGKSPNIVFADADIDAAVKGAFNGIFYGKGEVCNAGSRLFLEKSVHDRMMDKLLEKARRLQPGDPLDPKTRMGALVSKAQMEKVLGYVRIGLDEGAQAVLPGGRVGERGYFVKPAIFDSAEATMRIAQEEIFGPVLSVLTFENVDDLVEKTNSTIYGLAAGIWTRDIGKAHTLARRIQAGTVWINAYGSLSAESPFGGYKQSGFGRELGRYGIDLYTQVKSVWVALD